MKALKITTRTYGLDAEEKVEHYVDNESIYYHSNFHFETNTKVLTARVSKSIEI
jgi:hypothetical protein